MPRTTVVIVNWNTRELLLACLASLRAYAPEAAVVVVDNASSDGSAEAAAEAHPAITLIRNAENVGFARANNQGMALAATPYLWLLNSDAEARPETLERLEAYMEAHPEVAVLGAGLVNPDGSDQACSFAFPTPLATWASWLVLPGPVARWRDRVLDLAPRRTRGATDWVLGASMMVRREAALAVGLFDEGYFMYAEELDWCRRFRQAGWGVHLEPAAIVMHHGGGSTRRMPDRMLVELFRSQMRYYRRHLPLAARWWLPAALWLAAAWNAAYIAVRRPAGLRAATQWAVARAASQV